MCGSVNLTSTLHIPKNSKVDLKIVQCKDCNLVQGLCDETLYAQENDYFKNPDLTLSEISCDSSYSNVRVGKQQMAVKFFNILKDLPFDLSRIGSVIDVRAARGSFILRATEYFQSASVFVGLEQDLYLHPNEDLYDTSRVSILDYSVYNYPRSNQLFDFVYSCHTLEHYKDPNKYIKTIKNFISPQGYLFLDVPALDDFIDHDLLDDFFYDKHLLYFTKATLSRLLAANGFCILWSRSSGNGCIEALARPIDQSTNFSLKKELVYGNVEPSRISDYSQRLDKNRSQLSGISQNITAYIQQSEASFVAFGAGRILDAFKVYGNLDLALFDHCIDNYLCEASRIINGLKIKPLSELQQHKGLAFILFTRNSSQSLHELILTSHPKSKILHWSDFTDTKLVSI